MLLLFVFGFGVESTFESKVMLDLQLQIDSLVVIKNRSKNFFGL